MAFRLRRSAPEVGRPGFGLLSYRHTTNLGDEIQSIASRAFLPQVDRLIDRDALDRRPQWVRRPLKVILHGWFTHCPERWPPHPAIEPLILSLHLSDFIRGRGFSAAEALVTGENASYLRDHGPIGARDLWTLDLLQRNGIDSYFSGCLTLTLARPAASNDEDCIVLNDLPEEIAQAVVRRTHLRVESTTHENTSLRGFRKRSLEAQRLLTLYASARCVITSRLHCALPCLAMGTPVLLIPHLPSCIRFSGLLELTTHCTSAEFLAGNTDFDPDHPPANPQRHLGLRTALMTRCAAYVSEGMRSPNSARS